MSKVLTATAAAIALSVGLTALGTGPALASNYHHYHPWAQSSTQAGYPGQVSLQHYYAVPGYAGQVHRSAQHRDGYDGDRYWWGGDCWPTEPGGCD